ncbi:MAG TPA: hypothetical protein PKL73_18205 [Polyangiaceae bacterium]|jgi:hypothetical protein|nr:MAG: hypothetical protein BWY17_05053 [Deltaproteobacteria bacterium ADurb.Bin207]HNS98894.1 hypothetical protein [Polyangiaceae bacterium]HNZ25392.1 hypothetical protein [Polyangiaceae bacterium]HOD25217.1 hypothetical protein [Polyangiaceae bacterium]HOE51120.1 hypothetical protein [Polyangiaceae bacterium]
MGQVDQRLEQLHHSLQAEIASMLQRHEARVRGYDAVDLDLGRGTIIFSNNNNTLWTGRVELIGTFLPDTNAWRWWWFGADRPLTRSPLNAVFAAGQSHGIRTLTSAQPAIRGKHEAVQLANLCAALAKSQGVHVVQNADRMTFYGLFNLRSSVIVAGREPSPPPPEPDSSVVHHDSLITVGEPLSPIITTRQPIMSMPPPAYGPLPPVRPPPQKTPISEPTSVPSASDNEVRPPQRALVMPLAKVASTAVITHLPSGFQQALITLDLHVQQGTKARFFVVITALDTEGNLVAVPTPHDLMEAAKDLILEDARQGNGRWRRLTVRLTNRPMGISVHVEVVA